MKRKTAALMTALLLAVSLSACGGKTPILSDESGITSVEGSGEIKEENGEIKEETETIEETTPEEAEEDIVQKEMEKLRSTLGEIPYYGDASKCRMTAEQATAYAQLIADGLAGDFGFRGGYNENIDILTWDDSFQVYEWGYAPAPYETDRKNVMLADFAGDGIPYLYLFSSRVENSFEIYGWMDGEENLVASVELSPKVWHYLYEDENDECKVKLTYAGLGDMVHEFIVYSFLNGMTEMDSTWRAVLDVDGWHISENDVEKNVYMEEEYQNMWEKDHSHTLPYTCLYDVTPCTLEEMVDYLNAYAAAMSDGQSVPVEIKKTEMVRHGGTGIITKGEAPQWKIDDLEILRQCTNGDIGIGMDAGGSMYLYKSDDPGSAVVDADGFYFSRTDLNNDGTFELLISHRDENAEFANIYLPPSKDRLCVSFCGINREEGTYLAYSGSAYVRMTLYMYEGTSFVPVCELNEDGYTLTENGTIRELSEDEFYAFCNDWSSKHTSFDTDTHLDIENIENTFHVKIDTRYSGEWLVTDVE